MAGLDRFLADERLREMATRIREVHIKTDPLSLTIMFHDWHIETFTYSDGSNPYEWGALFEHMATITTPAPSE